MTTRRWFLGVLLVCAAWNRAAAVSDPVLGAGNQSWQYEVTAVVK
jgi:hypothetical protein